MIGGANGPSQLRDSEDASEITDGGLLAQSPSGRMWWLREYRAGKRPKRRLGVADDDVTAAGVTVFSWPQVLVAALGGDRPTLATSSSYTVNDALADYWLYRVAKSPALLRRDRQVQSESAPR
jgi:hypothetical protein